LGAIIPKPVGRKRRLTELFGHKRPLTISVRASLGATIPESVGRKRPLTKLFGGKRPLTEHFGGERPLNLL